VSAFSNKKATGKPRDAAGVLGLTFADIIHYRQKVTIVGLTGKDSKEVTSCHFQQPRCRLNIALSTVFMSE